MKQVILPISKASKYIDEGDVLLFRGQGWVSKFIGMAGQGLYTHVGLASWVNDNLECVEFREWKGGRGVNLAVTVQQHNYQIDVYRPNPIFNRIEFSVKDRAAHERIETFKGNSVTATMRKLLGLPYGWSRIWWIAKYKLFLLRLFRNYKKLCNDEVKDLVYPVCSTAVAYCFTKNGYDLVYNKGDEWIEPSDIARSTRLNYLFTLCADS